ncbi:hypothetical protein BD410DRAFT_783415 [Rickenella mellea]|uniref:S-adenosyl-L-methionine-dependent methyltransferase n=1 Tax=Rickenella mellea TaxID=50990 RepID=A0A4Y7QFE5_9AGAM|nr:hypothetical protein BD410DRAFT_783415 [Rickenella mellea]
MPNNLPDNLGDLSSSLPIISEISDLSNLDIARALDYIRIIYPSTCSRPVSFVERRSLNYKAITEDFIPDSGYASAEEEEFNQLGSEDNQIDQLHNMRSDENQRAFAVRWLTCFIKCSTLSAKLEDDTEASRRDELTEEAATLLTVCADTGAASDSLTRIFKFPLGSVLHGVRPPKIRVELNDAPPSPEDHTSVGLQSWASSIILSRMICEDTTSFGLRNPPSTGSPHSLRILELGAGTGLLSIVARKMTFSKSVQIIATDYHANVLANLRRNVHTNFPLLHSNRPPVEVHTFDWQHPTFSEPFDQTFDVILAADVIYHVSHARWIHDCVSRLLSRPSTHKGQPVFWLIIPLRQTGRHENVGETVEGVFPSIQAPELHKMENVTLGVLSVRYVGRSEGIGRADEGGYKLFKIGWGNSC